MLSAFPSSVTFQKLRFAHDHWFRQTPIRLIWIKIFDSSSIFCDRWNDTSKLVLEQLDQFTMNLPKYCHGHWTCILIISLSLILLEFSYFVEYGDIKSTLFPTSYGIVGNSPYNMYSILMTLKYSRVCVRACVRVCVGGGARYDSVWECLTSFTNTVCL